ncbi:MAG TPA: threonine-phosphate decarboxylase [Lachnospiraceae bacterium]|nr:threonine-phosphate decarboxylase [Lachnospiraceae bacterium]
MKEQVHGGDIYRHPGMLDFSSNMNPLGTPSSVTEAAVKSLEQISHYPDIQCAALTEALADYEQVPREQIICGNGAADLIFSLVQAVRPKKALVQAPTFAEYAQALESVGAAVSYYDSACRDFRIDRGYLEMLEESPDMAFLCNPNNPTGFLIEPKVLGEIAEACEDRGILLVVDECFQDFIPDEEKHTLKPRLARNPCLFLLKAFTKRYAMAGLRLGYGLCSNKGLLEKMGRVTQPWNVSIPAQAAGVAALKERAYVREGRRVVAEELSLMKQEMAAAGLQVYDSQANYIFFRGPVDLREHCLKQGVLIRSCSNYPGLDSGYFRVAVRRHEENQVLLRALRLHPNLK